MNMNRYSQQRGSTLIVILIIVMLIMVIGAIVIRQGLVSLNIATTSQAQNLMMQNADAAIFKVEDPTFTKNQMALNGLFGYLNTTDNRGKELVFCYRGTDSQFFDLTKSSLIYNPGGSSSEPKNDEIGYAGYCTADDFTSGRRAAITQVSVRVGSNEEDETAFANAAIGTNTTNLDLGNSEKVVVRAISVIPTLASNVSDDTINDCFRNHMSTPPTNTDGSNKWVSVTECFANANVPFTSHVSQYQLVRNKLG